MHICIYTLRLSAEQLFSEWGEGASCYKCIHKMYDIIKDIQYIRLLLSFYCVVWLSFYCCMYIYTYICVLSGCVKQSITGQYQINQEKDQFFCMKKNQKKKENVCVLCGMCVLCCVVCCVVVCVCVLCGCVNRVITGQVCVECVYIINFG